MTKRDVLAQFRAMWNDLTDQQPQWRGDTIAKAEAWNDYTDMLCKDGEITVNQYNNWTNPF